MKPKQQKVELTLGLNSNCANYDQSKGKYTPGLLSFYFGGSKLVELFAKAEHTPMKLYFVNRHNAESTKIGHEV